MSGMWSGRAIIVLGVVLVGVSLPAWGVDYSFTGVGVLTGDATSKALGVSRNGNYVTGDSGTGLDADGNTINPEAFIYNTALGSKVGIGFPPGWTTSSGEGIDAEGSDIFVAGTGKNNAATPKNQAFFYDATADAFIAIPFLPGGDTSMAHAVQCHNTDNDVMVTGRSDTTPPECIPPPAGGCTGGTHGLPYFRAYRWRTLSPDVPLVLDYPPTDSDGNGNTAEAFCIGFRSDGHTVIRGFTSESGYCGNHTPMAWTWYSGDSKTAEMWWADLTDPCPSPINSNVRGASADARYFVGTSTFENSTCESNREAYLDDTDDKDLDKTCNPPGGHWRGLQYCVVPDGSGGAGCIWGSTMLGSLPDHEGYSEGLGVSLDGQVVVGLARGFIVPTCGDWVDDHNVAFIWDPANGMRELKSVLVGYGLDLTGWELYEARSISSDGTVICGIGTHNGVAEGWVATIGRLGPMSACCDADLNCTDETQPDCEDGGGTYRAGKHCDTYTCCHTPYADSDGDGDVDQIDFAVFQLCYTGSGGGVPTGCKCWNRDQDTDVDAADFTAFNHCWTGPNVQFDPENPGSCVTD